MSSSVPRWLPAIGKLAAWLITTTAMILGFGYQLKNEQDILRSRISMQEKRLANQDSYFRDSSRERSEILVTLGRLEERIKSLQEQFSLHRLDSNSQSNPHPR